MCRRSNLHTAKLGIASRKTLAMTGWLSKYDTTADGLGGSIAFPFSCDAAPPPTVAHFADCISLDFAPVPVEQAHTDCLLRSTMLISIT